MQVAFGSAVPIAPVVPSSAPPEKAAQSAVARVDLQSPVAPVQLSQAPRPDSPSAAEPPLVYTRPLPTGAGSVGTPRDGNSTASPESGAAAGGASTNELPDVAVRFSPDDQGAGDGSSEATKLPEKDTVDDTDKGLAPESDDTARPSTRNSPDELPEAANRQSSATEVNGLTAAELDLVRQLSQRDQEVRQHEQAHVAVGGQHTGSPTYSYERGPDGRSYAVSGEVPIDVSPVPGDPEATIRKMETVQRAALAAAEPSPQDRSVAAAAVQVALQARAELSARAGGGDPRAEERQAQEDDAREARESREQEAAEKKQRADAFRRNQAVQTYEQFIQLGQNLSRIDQPVNPFSALA